MVRGRGITSSRNALRHYIEARHGCTLPQCREARALSTTVPREQGLVLTLLQVGAGWKDEHTWDEPVVLRASQMHVKIAADRVQVSRDTSGRTTRGRWTHLGFNPSHLVLKFGWSIGVECLNTFAELGPGKQGHSAKENTGSICLLYNSPNSRGLPCVLPI